MAIKVESKSVRNPQLYLEYTVYRKFLSGLTGFPRVWQYSQTKGHNYFAMTLLGDNLEALFERCGRRWSAKTLVMVAAQLVHRLEVMHDIEADGEPVDLPSVSTAFARRLQEETTFAALVLPSVVARRAQQQLH